MVNMGMSNFSLGIKNSFPESYNKMFFKTLTFSFYPKFRKSYKILLIPNYRKNGDLHTGSLYCRNIGFNSQTFRIFVLRHGLVTRELIKTCCFLLALHQSAITLHYLWPQQPLDNNWPHTSHFNYTTSTFIMLHTKSKTRNRIITLIAFLCPTSCNFFFQH